LWHTLNAEVSVLDHLTNSQDSWIGFEPPKIKPPLFKCNSIYPAINSQLIYNYTAEQKKRLTDEPVEIHPETQTKNARNATEGCIQRSQWKQDLHFSGAPWSLLLNAHLCSLLPTLLTCLHVDQKELS